MSKEERTKTLINNIKLNINEPNVYEFGLCVEQWKQILDYIEELQKQNQKLKEKIDKAVEYIKIYRSYQKIDNKDYLKGRDEIGCLDICQVDELLDILKGVE